MESYFMLLLHSGKSLGKLALSIDGYLPDYYTHLKLYSLKYS